jgi:hypothetical protein
MTNSELKSKATALDNRRPPGWAGTAAPPLSGRGPL